MRSSPWHALAFFLFVSWTNVSAQDQPVDEFTLRITEELRAKDTVAADLFAQANSARDHEDTERAAELYKQVLARQPQFFHARRRLSGVLLQLERYGEAITAAREAFSAAETPENRSALIDALVANPLATAESIAEAVEQSKLLLADRPPTGTRLLEELAALSPDLPPGLAVSACNAAVRAKDLPLLQRATAYLEQHEPDNLATHYYLWILAMSAGDGKRANAALERAREIGLPREAYERMRADTDHSRPVMDRYKPLALALAGVWLGGLLVLTLAGVALSSLALRSARRPVSVRTGESVGLSGVVRKAYQAVLWASCAFYYVSIPLLLIVVLATGGGLLYLFFKLGHIPVKLAIIIFGLTVFTAWAILRSLFVRGSNEDPGDRLDLNGHPRLRDLLKEVAGRIGTRPVDNVYMTPGTDLAVMERGGMLRQLTGNTERCLILGTGVLSGMQMGPFKAILAHEYGHFSNRDTAGGGFALGVRRSILAMAVGLARAGAAAWYNPAWLFLHAFQRIFLRISQGASRLQEVLADRWAAFAYGAEAFEAGLRHVIRRSLQFDVHVNTLLNHAIKLRMPVKSLYGAAVADPATEQQIEGAVEAAISAKPSPYDSHPAPAERFALVHALHAHPEGDLTDAREDVWSLFGDRAEIEGKMTTIVLRNVEAAHGVTIATAT